MSENAGVYERQLKLHAYCRRCDRWRVLDLAGMVRQGKGSLRLPLTVRCRDCGEVGQLQVRPPMPTWQITNGWLRQERERRVRAEPGFVDVVAGAGLGN